MLTGFSFTSNEYESILLNACKLLPGIEKIICVYYDPGIDNIEAIAMDKPDENSNIHKLQILSGRNEILKNRTSKATFDWTSRGEVPFTISRKATSQANIFKEEENVVLILRYTNPHDGLSDLIYLYLKHNFGNFGLGNSSKILSTDNKQIIATLIYNSFQSHLESIRKDKVVLQRFNKINKSLLAETEHLKSEIASLRMGYSESIINLCYQIAKEISDETGRQINFSDDAINKLKTFKGNIKSLHSIIWNSVEYASSLYFDQQNDEILINEQFIMLENIDIEVNTPAKQASNSMKYEKTIELLDKLENAARTAISRNNKLTSANVGRFCPQPITAPAISDALKKHRKKVIYLIEKYPDKWALLKREFKPVQNLIYSSRANQKSA